MISTAFFLLFDIMQNKKLHIATPQNMLLFAFLGSIVLSHVVHTYAWGAWDSFTKFGTIVIMFFLIVNALNSWKKIKIAIWLIVILTVVLAVQGIYQARNGIGWAGQPVVFDMEKNTQRITWIGIFNDPNDLALAFVIGVGFLLSFIFGNSRMMTKVVSLPLIAILLYGIYLTSSRGGFVALGATVTFYFLRRMKNKKFALMVGGVILLAIMIGGPVRLAGMSAEEDSAYGRIDAWHEGFQMLKSSPLFGVGYGMFTEDYPRTAHNSYILVAAEEGLVGFIIWIALIYLCFKGLRLLTEKNESIRQYSAGLEAGLCGYLSASYFLSRSYVPVLYILLALASAFTYTLLEKKDYRFGPKDMRFAGVVSMEILFVVWISMRISLRLVG